MGKLRFTEKFKVNAIKQRYCVDPGALMSGVFCSSRMRFITTLLEIVTQYRIFPPVAQGGGFDVAGKAEGLLSSWASSGC